jgi:hypothetical protein
MKTSYEIIEYLNGRYSFFQEQGIRNADRHKASGHCEKCGLPVRSELKAQVEVRERLAARGELDRLMAFLVDESSGSS